MEKKTIFEKGIITYSFIASAVLSGTSSLKAQIAYSGLINQSGTSQTFNINFDGSGATEMVIKFGPQSGVARSDAQLNWSNTQEVYAVGVYATSSQYGSTSMWYPLALNAGVTIGPPTTGGAVSGFATHFQQILVMTSTGPWINKSNKYIGVQFKIGANTHYGWVQLSVSGTSNFNATLHDFAYETTPDLGIVAGSLASLPVELINFEAFQFENAVKLLWETATEVNNYGFEIERNLTDSKLPDWETLGFVEGHGNSNSPKSYEYTDETAPADALEYRLKQIDTDGKFEYYSLTAKINNAVTEVEENNLPLEFVLEQNYPNPFNPSTVISYQLAEASKVELKVYDLLGKEVATLVNREQAAGNHTVNFDASGLPSGMYVYKIIAGHFIENRKMMLMK